MSTRSSAWRSSAAPTPSTGLRVPLREPRPRARGRRQRHRLHRPLRRGARDGRQQGHGQGARDRGRRAGPRVDAAVDRRGAAARAGGGIGFPIFAKAVAGGGGRGMRRVERAEDLEDALRAAMREADSAFGDPTMFLEQAVLRPRHIEVQVLADAAGRPCTCSSATARCSAGTRRSWRSRPRRTWIPRSATPCTPTRSRSPGASATSTPARSSSCSTPTGRAPGSTSSSR